MKIQMNEQRYNDRSFDHSSIFNKLQEESNRKGYTINRGIVNNKNYDSNSTYMNDSDKIRSVGKNQHNISAGKLLGGMLVIGGITWAVHKFIYTPIKNYFDDLSDEVVVKSGNDNRIFSGNCRAMTRKEMRELNSNKSEIISLVPSDYTITDD